MLSNSKLDKCLCLFLCKNITYLIMGESLSSREPSIISEIKPQYHLDSKCYYRQNDVIFDTCKTWCSKPFRSSALYKNKNLQQTYMFWVLNKHWTFCYFKISIWPNQCTLNMNSLEHGLEVSEAQGKYSI